MHRDRMSQRKPSTLQGDTKSASRVSRRSRVRVSACNETTRGTRPYTVPDIWYAVQQFAHQRSIFRRLVLIKRMCGFGGLFGVSSESSEEGFGMPFGDFWDPFCGLRQWVCAASEKVVPRTVFRCESQRASIAKTGKPYSTSFKNRKRAPDGGLPPACVPRDLNFLPRTCFGNFKLSPTSIIFGIWWEVFILVCFSVCWRSDLGLFWHA